MALFSSHTRLSGAVSSCKGGMPPAGCGLDQPGSASHVRAVGLGGRFPLPGVSGAAEATITSPPSSIISLFPSLALSVGGCVTASAARESFVSFLKPLSGRPVSRYSSPSGVCLLPSFSSFSLVPSHSPLTFLIAAHGNDGDSSPLGATISAARLFSPHLSSEGCPKPSTLS